VATELSDSPDQSAAQPDPHPAGPASAGPASAGLAEAAPPGGHPTAGPPGLVVHAAGAERPLRAGTEYRVGRDPECHIVLADPYVSWRHGVLRADGDAWIFEDTGSTNGTFLGPDRVTRTEIRAVTELRLGHVENGPVLRCVPGPAAGLASSAAETRTARPTPGAAGTAAPGTGTARPTPGAAGTAAPGTGTAGTGTAGTRTAGTRTADTRTAGAGPAGTGEVTGTRPERITPGPAAATPAAATPATPAAATPATPAAATPAIPVARASSATTSTGMLSGVDRSPTTLMSLPRKTMRIGRSADNDLVLSDLEVSRRHAELRRLPSGDYEITDLGSHNGTYVNGRRVSAQVLTADDIVGIGRSTFRLTDGQLRHFVDEGEITFAAHELVVKVAGGKTLLDRVSFPLPEKCLLGVIGPSGAGKSTLLSALTGMRPPDGGTVFYDNRDLYQHYGELRYRIGLVPQENILHTQLTARRALEYSAELRFPNDTRASERETRVTEVMSELGLTPHADTRADRLSGGQLKRVNMAQELLTKPSVLFLDEPTSGLDPGLDKTVMEQMRDLAHSGRTVIVVTHSVASLNICDRVLVLVPGGKVAYYGPPAEGLRYFGTPGWAEVFQAFDRQPDRDWQGQFAASPAYAEYVLGQPGQPDAPAADEPAPAAPVKRQRGAFGQLATLTRRYARVIAADRGYLLFMGLLPLVLGLLIHFVPAKQGLAGVPGTNLPAQELLSIMVICACLAGTASSVREVVKERSIYIRERAAGLSPGAYLLSKLAVLGVISVVQSLVIVLLGLAGRTLPAHGVVLRSLPLVELLIAIGALALASMCLGLFVSAVVTTSEKAMPVLVMLTMGQIILSGGVLPLAGLAGLSQLAWLAPARWGFAATASTVNLNVLLPPAGDLTDPLWRPTSANWLRDVGLTLGLGLVFLLLAWVRLHLLGPRRHRLPGRKAAAPAAPVPASAPATAR
jgi:ABC transport system ATP-binding/permease protein